MKNYKLRSGNLSLEKLPNYTWDKFGNIMNSIPEKLSKRTKLSNIQILQLHCFYCLLALTFSRPSELLDLKVEDIRIISYNSKNIAIVSLTNLKFKRFFRKNINGKVIILKNNTRDKMAVKNVPINLDNEENRFLIRPFISYLKLVADKPELRMFSGMNIFKAWYYFVRATNETDRRKDMQTGLNVYAIKHIAINHIVVDKDMDVKTVTRLVGHRDLNSLEFYFNLQTKDIIKQLLDKGA